MEPPISFDADAVRAKKTELFQAIHPISPADAVRGANRNDHVTATTQLLRESENHHFRPPGTVRFEHHDVVAEFGLVGATMHKADECVPVGELRQLAAIYRAVLAEFV